MFRDKGPSNVIGHWEVDQREPDCASYWNWYSDHVRKSTNFLTPYSQLIVIVGLCFTWIWSTGGSISRDMMGGTDGMQRIEHYLENLPQGSDWREFCATTPVSFRGMHFVGAQFCFQKVRC